MKLLTTLFIVSFSTCFSQDTITSIAFGSCAHQDKPTPILNLIPTHHPDLFIFLGDNIYADTKNMGLMKKKYKKLGKKAEYKKLKESTPILATWDDHDYGMNDVGRHYEKKKESKKIFLKFFHEPKNSERRKHEGIYTSYIYHVDGKILQIILLDNRTFRDDLLPYDGSLKTDSLYKYELDYSPIQTPDSTFLGEMQWKWLETELVKPADVRIIGSSTQFATQFNGYETWANFPREQERMFNLINSTKANGVFFISGDVHYSELSKRTDTGTYPIYDLTASGLTEEWKFATPNKYRIGNAIMENHFGLIKIDWKAPGINVTLEIWDVNNQLRIQQLINMNDLK